MGPRDAAPTILTDVDASDTAVTWISSWVLQSSGNGRWVGVRLVVVFLVVLAVYGGVPLIPVWQMARLVLETKACQQNRNAKMQVYIYVGVPVLSHVVYSVQFALRCVLLCCREHLPPKLSVPARYAYQTSNF
jgi:hypothetical protein